ncbi:hypothetical protein [Zoogloea sp. 1C4]|uniref:hypothetical protein n=1 Tax=Zoogloea sp. 1C4 TaxID=2570190 RepID=UPI001290C3A6|nr:hypothetical protein [Zoogloea sp. 1C4]
MTPSKFSAATRARRSARLARRNRGYDLTCLKRNRLNDLTTSRRHCKQYLTNARRKGWLVLTKEWRDL